MEQMIDQVTSDFTQCQNHQQDTYLPTCVPALLVQAARENTVAVDVAFAAWIEGWILGT